MTHIARVPFAVLVFAAALASIASTAESPPSTSPQETFPDLVDCTAKGLAELEGSDLFDWKPANLDAEDSTAVLSAATVWARENCYVPCKFQMCGMVLQGPGERVTVYIRPRDVQFGDGGIWPEASIVLNRGSWEVVEYQRFHTGCTMWTGECEWKSKK